MCLCALKRLPLEAAEGHDLLHLMGMHSLCSAVGAAGNQALGALILTLAQSDGLSLVHDSPVLLLALLWVK